MSRHRRLYRPIIFDAPSRTNDPDFWQARPDRSSAFLFYRTQQGSCLFWLSRGGRPLYSQLTCRWFSSDPVIDWQAIASQGSSTASPDRLQEFSGNNVHRVRNRGADEAQ